MNFQPQCANLICVKILAKLMITMCHQKRGFSRRWPAEWPKSPTIVRFLTKALIGTIDPPSAGFYIFLFFVGQFLLWIHATWKPNWPWDIWTLGPRSWGLRDPGSWKGQDNLLPTTHQKMAQDVRFGVDFFVVNCTLKLWWKRVRGSSPLLWSSGEKGFVDGPKAQSSEKHWAATNPNK